MDADAADYDHYRTSLHSCWNDPSCTRALFIAHGGAWKLADPAYGSTAAYDAAFEKKINDLRGKTTIIMVTHREDHMRLADQMLVMNRGELTHAGPSDQVLQALKGKRA